MTHDEDNQKKKKVTKIDDVEMNRQNCCTAQVYSVMLMHNIEIESIILLVNV